MSSVTLLPPATDSTCASAVSLLAETANINVTAAQEPEIQPITKYSINAATDMNCCGKDVRTNTEQSQCQGRLSARSYNYYSNLVGVGSLSDNESSQEGKRQGCMWDYDEPNMLIDAVTAQPSTGMSYLDRVTAIGDPDHTTGYHRDFFQIEYRRCA